MSEALSIDELVSEAKSSLDGLAKGCKTDRDRKYKVDEIDRIIQRIVDIKFNEGEERLDLARETIEAAHQAIGELHDILREMRKDEPNDTLVSFAFLGVKATIDQILLRRGVDFEAYREGLKRSNALQSDAVDRVEK